MRGIVPDDLGPRWVRGLYSHPILYIYIERERETEREGEIYIKIDIHSYRENIVIYYANAMDLK